LLNSFRDGGQPHVLIELPSGQRYLLTTDMVATDWEHDSAILRARLNPFQSGYQMAYLALTTFQLDPSKNTISVSLCHSKLQTAYTFDTPVQERSEGEILSYQYTRTENGRQIELLLYSQKVIPEQSSSPVISQGSGETVGFIEGRW